MKQRNCSFSVAKTKALISVAVAAKLVCAFVFAYADCWFSDAATCCTALLNNGCKLIMNFYMLKATLCMVKFMFYSTLQRMSDGIARA